MEEKILEKMLDNLIEEAGPIAIKEMESEQDDVPEVEFSKEHNEKMKKIFAEARKELEAKSKEKAKTAKISDSDMGSSNTGKRGSNFRKIVIIAAVLILVLGLISPITSGWRESFKKYFLDMKTEYSDVKKVNDIKNNLRVDNVYFGYVPEGFKYDATVELQSGKVIEFVSDNDKYFYLKITKSRWSDKVDTENIDVEDIVVNNKDMAYLEKDGKKELSWNENNKLYLLSSNIDKELMINIAQNIEIIEE